MIDLDPLRMGSNHLFFENIKSNTKNINLQIDSIFNLIKSDSYIIMGSYNSPTSSYRIFLELEYITIKIKKLIKGTHSLL